MDHLSSNTPTLYTERLILRRFGLKDLEALFAIFSDEAVNTFLPWFPLRTPAEARRFFEERYAGPYRQPEGYRYAVCRREDDLPVGFLNVDPGSAHDLGYGLRREFWGQGLIPEAGAALIALLRRRNFGFLTATHDRSNPASGRVMQKLGMKYCYSYLEQWQPKDIPVVFRLYQLNFDGSDRIFEGYRRSAPEHFVEDLPDPVRIRTSHPTTLRREP